MDYEELIPAINRCIELNLPFAVFAYPGEDDFRFLCSMPDEAGENELSHTDADSEHMEIGMFNFENTYSIGITAALTPDKVMSLPSDMRPLDEPDIRPIGRSTAPILYYAQIHEIVKSLKGRKGKTVLSRVISGSSNNADVTAIAREYFAAYPDTFRYLYFTQETGLWIGASPELLLDYDLSSGNFMTMALAGTRRCAADEPWDEKNVDEHEMVVEFINSCLISEDASDVVVKPMTSRKFGEIEHLCTIFTGHSDNNPRKLVYSLSPTPAVAGYPREDALRTIYRYEAHARNCYAGFIAVNDPVARRFRAFVNLRCALLSPEKDRINYNIYAGGGLTAQSVAQAEWEETESKSASLRKILEKTSPPDE